MNIHMRNQKGFTLIELSIVLVIIGIILAAVLKGQDLIQNARAKKVANLINQWQVPMMTYYDRKGMFPGDTASPPNGLIVNIMSLTASLNSATVAHPDPIMGDVNVAITGNALVCGGQYGTKNYMVITLPVTANQSFFETIDTNVDGTANGISGKLLNCGAAGQTAPAAWGPATSILTYIF
jgi:prepilin-type N-terminal cleavage/methylation domain-containing protein